MEYQTDFGKPSLRIDRFHGEPSWLEFAIREYELGPRGPHHECLVHCECIACCRLVWLHRSYYECLLNKQWDISLSLDDTMRRKWQKCCCMPKVASYPPESQCKCIMFLPTQEFIPSHASPLEDYIDFVAVESMDSNSTM